MASSTSISVITVGDLSLSFSNNSVLGLHDYVAPLFGPTRLADPNQFQDACLILFVYFLFFLFIFFQKCRDPNPWPDSNGYSESEPGLLRPFPFILSNILFISFNFRVFNYMKTVSNGRTINIYFYIIRLPNGVPCLYKMIYKTLF